MRRIVRRARALTSYLIAFGLALALPPLVYAAVVTCMVAESERHQTERVAQEAGLTFANDFEHEIASQIEILRALATSPAILGGDMLEFRRQVLDLAAWNSTVYALRDSSGRFLATTGGAPSDRLPAPSLSSADLKVLATGQPIVSDLIREPASGDMRVAVVLPVEIDGRITYLLSSALSLKGLGRMVNKHVAPTRIAIGLCDRDGRIVAWSGESGPTLGQSLPGFPHLTGAQGRWTGTGVGGVPVSSFYVRSETGFLVVSGMRLADLEAPLRESLIRLLALGLALLVLGYLVALAISRAVTGTFKRLGDQAAAMARGLPVQMPDSFAVTEAAQLAEALLRSTEELRRRDEQLARANRDLELRVVERTAEVERNAALLSSTLDAMDQGLIMIDAEGLMAVSNRRAHELLELDPVFMASKPHYIEFRRLQASRGEYGPGGSEFERWIASGELVPDQHTYERTRPNGVVLEVRTVPLPNGGVVRTYTDVTARHHAEAELRSKTQLLKATLANMDQGLITIDRDGVVQVCNDRAIALLGLPAEMMRAGPTLAAVRQFQLDSGDFVRSDAAFVSWVATRGLEPRPHAYERERPNGTCLEIRTVPMGDGGLVRTYTDITEGRRREAALRASEARLRESEERLAFALDSGSDGLWDWNIECGEYWLSDRWYAMLGYSRGDFPVSGETLAALIHPEDYPLVRSAIRNHLVSQTGSYSCETRIRHHDGSYSWFLVRGRVVARAEDGQALRMVGTQIDITARKEAESQIAYLARHDPLTNLPNRTLFRTCLDQRLAEMRRGGGEVAILSLDLDRFKAVNDTYGHPAGDALLWETAERLKAALRAEDIVARLGGDEFAILLAGTDKDDARAARVAQRLIDAVSQPVWIDGQEIEIGVSIGIAVETGAELDGDGVFKRADHALYRAKAEGRNLFRFYDGAMDAAAEERRRVEVGLRGALDRGELQVHYQPIVRADDAEICGFEALLRWHHPERGLVSPLAFIPVAEETGLIVPIGNWVLRSACLAAASWPGEVRVAVNVSAVQFRREGLVDAVISALAASGLPASRLELEITESVLMQEGDAVLGMLDRLRAFGVRIALDDFGTGYSSLSYLRRFPLDKLKIDRSFIADIDDAGTASIVRAIIGMGSRLGMRVTAEGVETQEQLDFLRQEGCDEAQGYLFSAPVALAEATGLIPASVKEAA